MSYDHAKRYGKEDFPITEKPSVSLDKLRRITKKCRHVGAGTCPCTSNCFVRDEALIGLNKYIGNPELAVGYAEILTKVLDKLNDSS